MIMDNLSNFAQICLNPENIGIIFLLKNKEGGKTQTTIEEGVFAGQKF